MVLQSCALIPGLSLAPALEQHQSRQQHIIKWERLCQVQLALLLNPKAGICARMFVRDTQAISSFIFCTQSTLNLSFSPEGVLQQYMEDMFCLLRRGFIVPSLDLHDVV